MAAIIKSDQKITNATKNNIKVGQKIVISSKKLKGEEISFTKISDAIVGDEVYILVKTDKFENGKKMVYGKRFLKIANLL